MLYLGLLILFIIFAVRFDFSKHPRNSDFLFYFSLILLIAVTGLRYKVGGDSLVYYEKFKEIPLLSNLLDYNIGSAEYSPLWIILSSISKSIIEDFAFFQIVHGTIINLIIFRFIKTHTQYRFTAILIYYVFLYLYFNMEIMRESLAICTFLLAYPYFLDKKWLKYYVIALIAFLFHPSAIIIFIFPIFRYTTFNILNTLIVLLIAVSIGLLFIFIPSLLQLVLFTQTITDKFEFYSVTQLDVLSMFYVFFFYAFLPYFIIMYNKKYDKLIFQELHLLYFMLVFVFIAVSGFHRFLNYLAPFMMVYFADFLNSLYRNPKYRTIRTPVIFLIFLIAFYPKKSYYFQDTSHLAYNTHKYNLWYPYTSIFNMEEYPKREALFYGNFGKNR